MKKLIAFALPFLISSYAFGKEAIHPEQGPAAIGAYSPAIKSGNTVYISGQIGIDPKSGNLVSDDLAGQFTQAIKNLEHITKAAGGNLEHIVKTTIFVTDLAQYAQINEVMSHFFKKPYPARSVVEVKGLPKAAKIEIEAIMVK